MPRSMSCTASWTREFVMSEAPHPNEAPHPHPLPRGEREPSRPPLPPGERVGVRVRGQRRRALRHVTFTIGFALTALLLLTAALSLGYTPRDPLEMSLANRLEGPSEAHP